MGGFVEEEHRSTAVMAAVLLFQVLTKPPKIPKAAAVRDKLLSEQSQLRRRV